ncbi:MAG: DDE-type integrase/transposase/recombinase [Gammaproteobacteria bacterium]|nr:DDE-type integrase/transposase/recombinase [Gammaproteobacteria bacterium]
MAVLSLYAEPKDVEELLQSRGIQVSYESIREWGLTFGQGFANQLKKRTPKRGGKWHLNEVCIVINRTKHWLWRAVDQEGYELDILLQSRRHKKAALCFFKKLLKGLLYVPRVFVYPVCHSMLHVSQKRKLLLCSHK